LLDLIDYGILWDRLQQLFLLPVDNFARQGKCFTWNIRQTTDNGQWLGWVGPWAVKRCWGGWAREASSVAHELRVGGPL